MLDNTSGYDWVGHLFSQDDGKRKWTNFRPEPEYPIDPAIKQIFREAQSLRITRLPPSSITYSPNSDTNWEENPSFPVWEHELKQKVDPVARYQIIDPADEPRQAEEEFQYKCKKCGSITWVAKGKTIQCGSCNRRRQRKWRKNHLEEARAIDRHRKSSRSEPVREG